MLTCKDCMYFTRDLRDPLFPEVELYDCFSCSFARYVDDEGRLYCPSDSFAFSCKHFVLKSCSSSSIFYDEHVGDQLTLFDIDSYA